MERTTVEKVSLWVKHAKVFNSYLKKFEEADVAVKGERFYYIDRKRELSFEAAEVLDAQGKYMIPGFIDIHMHIESSMITPLAMAECLAANGVTTIVSEPHEMANVKGVRGVEEMIRAGKDAPIDIYYGIPSSVPSTSEELETTGGVIDFPAMKGLLDHREVACVGEVMNYRQVIRENHLEISKFLDYVRAKRPDLPVEGHCPSLEDLELARFLYLGIDADHTEHDLEEVRQRLENGMFFEIQDKMLKPEILAYIRENNLYEYCAFVTDDTMADSLIEEGHLNAVVEKAVAFGFPLEQAVYCATYTPARRMHLTNRGAIAPGKLADFQLLEDVRHFCPALVFKSGRQIYRKGEKAERKSGYEFPRDFYESVRITDEQIQSLFAIKAPKDEGKVTVRVIENFPDCTQTHERLVEMPVRNGRICWQESGCILGAVFERHGKNHTVGIGFFSGSCHGEGTVATTYCHDHHNLLVAGDDPEDMASAVRRIVEMQGGYVVIKDGRILAELPLPVGGILSDHPAKEIGAKLKQVRLAMESLGYVHENPIMSFSCLGLPVSPELKLTNFGLIDVKNRRRVSLTVS
ncbi:MAG: amidohydrolase family protein [Acetatifactor sp.]|nr:amidohydrolase family protein [Acetatifactor sp.]